MENDYKDYMSNVREALRPVEDRYAPHIAVVDDCMDSRAEMRNFVRTYFRDVPVRTYRDGLHFWDTIAESGFPLKLKTESIRAIFLDMHMPEMCGRETLKKIRAKAEMLHIPVFMMSRDTCAHKIAQVKELGATDFISKPFDKLALSLLVHKGSYGPHSSTQASNA